MRVAVLVSVGCNPVSGTPRAAVNDVIALEVARGLGEPALFHAGRAEICLDDYLAYGAEAVEVVRLSEGADAAEALAARLGDFDLILTGSRAERGEGSGLLPYLIAKALDLPIVAGALSLSLEGKYAKVTQFLPKGVRRQLDVTLPAVVAIHPLAPVKPRFAFARKLAGRIVTGRPSALSADGASPWTVEAAGKMLSRLKAKRKQAGPDRMLGAIAPAAKGGTVIVEGSSADKAKAVLDYLRKHHLTEL